MNFIKSTISIILLLLFYCNNAFSQDFLQNLPKEKSPSEYTLFDYRDAFESYWAPYKVVNGYYIDDEGNEQKAAYWKPFNRWYYEMEKRANQKTGEFPTTSAMEQFSIWLKSNPQNNNKRMKSGSGNQSSWTSLGPNSSDGGYAGTGRLNCVSFHPSDNNTFWVGAPSGGLWVTTNGGSNWTVLTDNNAVLGVSDIGIPADYATSSTIYIATGDRNGGSMWSLGGGQSNDNNSIGVLKSTDGGSTWATTGLTYAVSSRKILSKILVHPSSYSTLYVAGTDGILKSVDGGTNWTNIYSGTTVIDIKFKPSDPTVLYASTKDYWGSPLILVSTNSGSTWTSALSLATTDMRIELAVSPANSAYVYAVATTRSGGLKGIYKSTNSGASFTQVYDGTALNHNLLSSYTDGSGGTSGQGNYDLALAVSNTNINEVYVAGVVTHKSTDGGASWSAVNCWTSHTAYNKNNAPVVHADHHMLKFRGNDNALFEVNDGGIYKTVDNGSTWTHLTGNLVISQLYRLAVSQTATVDVLGGLQDNGVKLFTNNIWYDVKGGDGMDCHIDQNDINNQYGAYVRGQISRTTTHWIGNEIDISPAGKSGTGSWLTPYIIDPNNSNTLYAGYNNVYKSTDKGNTWSVISSMNTTDAYGRGNLKTIAVAPSNSNVIYTADPSTLWATTDGGTSWNDITSGLPVSSNYITYISVKNNDPNTVWITFGGYDTDRIFESKDGGSNWTNISAGLPNIPIMCLIENKQNTGVTELYVGTDVGIYLKDGISNWTDYNTSLPNVVVNDLEINYDNTTPTNSVLYAGTSGRGVWSSPLNYAGCTLPTTQAINFASTHIASTTMDISWTRGDGDKVIVIAHENAAVNSNPSSGSEYVADAAFGSGDQIGTGNYVVYNGTGTSVSLSNLTTGATIHYAIYEYSAADFCYLAPALTGNATTNGPPSVSTVATTAITGSTVTSGGEVVSLNGSTLTHKGVCWSTSTNPTIANSHTNDIAQGTGIGTYTSSITGLSGNLTYYVRAYATNASGTNYGNEETFVTDCGTATVFPFTESFEGKICWGASQANNNDGSWRISFNTQNPNGISAQDGAFVAVFNSHTSTSGSQTILISPDIDISTLNKPMLSYWLYHDTGFPTNDDKIQLGVIYNSTIHYVGASVSRYDGTTGWARYTLDLSDPSYPSVIQLGFLATSAQGNDINIDHIKVFEGKEITDGKTTLCSPDFVRNGGMGVLYFYDQYEFSVEYDGNVDITADWTTGTSFDGYLYLYSPSFDPENPAANLIASNNDFGSVDYSQIAGQAITAATNYVVVATTFDDNVIGGSLQISIEGTSVISTSPTTDYNGIPAGMAHNIPSTDGTTREADYECDDSNEWTHYYDDNSTIIDYSDDKLLLSVKKNENDLGATTVSVEGISGASFINPLTAPYVSNFGGWFVFNRYWKLTPTTQPATDVSVRFYYTDGDFTTLNAALTIAGRTAIATQNDMAFFKINDLNAAGYDPDPSNGHDGVPRASAYNTDGSWIYGNALAASTSKWALGTYNGGYYGETVISHFSGGGGGASGNEFDGSLPIELMSFIGYADGEVNRLEWKTATELNADHFIIERKNFDNEEIETIGTLKASGNSNTIQAYSLTDKAPLPKAYYRLINKDYDGVTKAYNWILIARNTQTLEVVNLYPNPTTQGISLEFTNPESGNISIEIIDLVGRVVKTIDYTANKGFQRIELDLLKLQAGTYFLSIDNAKDRVVEIILKK